MDHCRFCVFYILYVPLVVQRHIQNTLLWLVTYSVVACEMLKDSKNATYLPYSASKVVYVGIQMCFPSYSRKSFVFEDDFDFKGKLSQDLKLYVFRK